jgi:purine-binding chemotaxis protein CheW
MKQFVTFRIDEDLLGIDVLKIREINPGLDITPVPRAPDYVRGLVNLRGETITILDLGIRLGLAPRDIAEASHNVVLRNHPVGLLVDSIGDMVECGELQVEAPPANVGSIEGKYIEGVVRLNSDLLVILKTEKIVEYDGI